MGPDVPPGEDIYKLEQQWFKSCKLTHDLFCLCSDWRQHIVPGCGIFHEPGAGPTGGGGADDDGDLDDIMVHFDIGDPTTHGDEDTG